MSDWDFLKKEVVEAGYCCGCGLCAGVCPVSCLDMHFNKYGEYNPELCGKCTKCGLCLKVCPFLNGNPSEDDIARQLYADTEGIQHQKEAGYYLNSYVGSAPDAKTRWDGASGGAATWVLCHLLENKMVDHVLIVAKNKAPEKLFKFTVASTVEEVIKCSKSVYYPVEVSEVIKCILENDDRFAVVGLPCVCKAIRLAQQNNNKLKRQILYVLGLVCGQQKSTGYTAHISKLSGLDKKPTSVCFRKKKEGTPANNYYFSASVSGKTIEKAWDDGISLVWLSGEYNLPSCFYCDDVFAECADLVFMDAWLEPYMNNPKGTSMVLVRKEVFLDFLSGSLKEVEINPLLESQRGVILKKRKYLGLLLQLRQALGIYVPEKRVKPVWRIPRTGELRYILNCFIAAAKRRNTSNNFWSKLVLAVRLFPLKMAFFFLNLIKR